MTPTDTSPNRRQEILTAAMTCFMRKGYHQATMDDIVAESGLSKGTLYWYFKSKKELFLALIESALSPMETYWNSFVNDKSKSTAEKLKLITDLFRVEVSEMAPFFGIVLEAWSLTPHDPDVENLLKEIYKPYLISFTNLIDEGRANGEFSVEDAESTALVILILYDGLTLYKGLDLIEADWLKIMNATEKLLFKGLGVSDGRDS